MNFNNEELKQAKMAKSAEDLIALAKEKGIELTEEQGQLYLARLKQPSGEFADEELENVSGGADFAGGADDRYSGGGCS